MMATLPDPLSEGVSMKTILVVAVLLLAALAVGSAVSGSPAETLVGPHVIAKGALTGQTATIPTTTVVKPTRDGLFRLSAYGTITTPALTSSSQWNYSFSWIDDSGFPQGGGGGILCGCNDAAAGAFDWNSIARFGVTLVFEAKAGTPITCILFASARFGLSVLVGDWIGIRREAVHILRRSELAAWIIDRPPALLSQRRGESQAAREPAYKDGERGVTGSGSRSSV